MGTENFTSENPQEVQGEECEENGLEPQSQN